ncbi:MAG: membrane lipoprotein lipid attachment site-containing protein [bacterium]|nr:membrane lipoprotein lipid attachment site-containing protein [bacterium]
MKRILLGLVIAIALTGCSSEKKTEAGQKDNQATQDAAGQVQDTAGGSRTVEQKLEYTPSDFVHTFDGESVSIAGITFTPPSQWTDYGASDMKAAYYSFGPLENEVDSATVAVFYFGEGKGGSVESNLERWINQTAMPDGRDPHTGAIQYELEVDGMKVHMLSIFGFYEVSMGGPMSRQKENKENYRLVGAIVEAPQGNVFFKLTGPDYTARIMIEGFMPMIKAILKT